MRLHQLLKVLDLSVKQAAGHDRSGEQHEKCVVNNITDFGRFTHEEALLVLPLTALVYNPPAMNFLEGHGSLPIFEAELYFRPKKGHAILLDLIRCFGNGPDPVSHENNLRKDTELDCIALRFSPTARDTIVLLFLPTASVLSSLSGFMHDSISLQNVIDVLNRFLSPLWAANLTKNFFEGTSSEARVVQGWSLVHECFKIFCQDLALAEATDNKNRKEKSSLDEGKKEADIPNARKPSKGATAPIGKESVMRCIPMWYHKLLTEFFAWVYTFVKDTVSQSGFLSTIQMVAGPFLSGLLSASECNEVPKDFNMELLQQLIASAADGEPSMAEVRYDPVTMIPTLHTPLLNRRVKWKHSNVLSRCSSLITLSTTRSYIRPFRSPGREAELPVTADGEYRPSKKHSRDDNISELDSIRAENRSSPSKKRIRIGGSAHADFKHVVKTSSPHNQRTNMSKEERVETTLGSNTGSQNITEQQNARLIPPSPEPKPQPNQALTCVSFLRDDPIEAFFTEITDWNPGPQTNVDDPAIGQLSYQNDIWLKKWNECFKHVIKRDVTSCRDMVEYRNHWKPLIMMEMRGSAATAIRKSCPSSRNKTPNLLKDFRNEFQNLRLVIVKKSPTRDLIHLRCHSNDSQFTRALAREIQGGMMCMGYIEKESDGSRAGKHELSIFACRNVSWNDEEYSFGRTNRREDDVLDVVEMSLTISRKRFDSANILVGDRVIMSLLTTYTPYLRMFKALHEASSIPPAIQKTLCDVMPGEEEKLDDALNVASISEESKTFRNLEAMVDPGCVAYLGAIRMMGKLNSSQHIATLSALASMGDCSPGTSSLSMIKGPPGTGKTDCILYLIGALMHHSRYGHVGIKGHQPIDVLRRYIGKDSILRHSSNDKSFKFLITASSNNAVGNVMLRAKNRGIPAMDGSLIRPEMCRIAKNNYDFADLSNLSINFRALPYDRHIHHPDRPNRKTASTAAIRSYKKECMLYFATLTTVAGPQWKDYKIPVDVVITDEGAHPFEAEVILPFITTRRYTPSRRMLGVIVGDDDQLVAPALALQLIREHKMCLAFNYEYQMTSLFQRLVSRNRVTCCMLTFQYRMPPSIANIHFRYFYDNKVLSGCPEIDFKDAYNQGPYINNGYASFTCIDTSRCQDRFERKEEGGVYYNDVEISVIDSVLWKLFHLVREDLRRLDGAIAILIPYRSQVERVRTVLMEQNKFVRFATRKLREQGKNFDIVIDTCDGMQGKERDIVIFAATRSNEEHEVGFLSDKRRLNVAMSRMRKLMIFVGDFSTLTTGQAEYFSYIDRASSKHDFGAHRVTWK